MEDDPNGKQPKWKTTQKQRRPNPKNEDDLTQKMKTT